MDGRPGAAKKRLLFTTAAAWLAAPFHFRPPRALPWAPPWGNILATLSRIVVMQIQLNNRLRGVNNCAATQLVSMFDGYLVSWLNCRMN